MNALKTRADESDRALEKKIGYRFKRKAWLCEALIHPSYRYETDGLEQDNQRLEFLGDAVLGLLAADLLSARYPQADEGRLTALKSLFTSGTALATAARALDLGDHLRLGRGEADSGGADRDSNLEDALEALLGAVWLDGGLRSARRVFEKHIFQCLEDSSSVHVDNPKGALQEYAQKEGRSIPVYTLLHAEGPDHDRHYRVEVSVCGHLFRGEGSSRRDAEKAAALQAVQSLEVDGRENDTPGKTPTLR